MPTVAQLMKALPEAQDAERAGGGDATPALAEFSLRPVPVGRLRRIRLLVTLHAKIAAAYLLYCVRGWLTSAAGRERMMSETHRRTAARVLDSKGYLRGAAMKVGQTLANFPDVAPAEFVDTLEQL